MSDSNAQHVVRPKFPRPKGDGNGSTPVVRLSPHRSRDIQATTLTKRVAPAPTVLARMSVRAVHAPALLSVGVKHKINDVPTLRTSSRKTTVGRFTKGIFAKQMHHTMSLSLGLTFASGMLGKFAAILLIPMLLLQPLLPVYAADESVAGDASTTVAVADTSTAPAQDTPSTPADTPETSAATPAVPESASPSSGDTVSTSSVSSDSSAPTVLGDATTTETMQTSDVTASSISSDIATTTSFVPEAGGVSSETAATSSGDSSNAHDATTTENTAATTDETATATEEVPVVDEAAVKAAEAEAARQAEEARQEQIRQSIKKEVVSEFTKGCLTLDGVGYYCLKDFDGGAKGALTPSAAVTAVTSQKDPTGNDKEIFITKGDESIQLTHNDGDDAFPAMDVSGKSVVWQGMVDGRWQIFVADVSSTGTPVITQLTHGTESNFNPRVDGDTIVWQGWVNGNWEIFLAERLSPAAYYPLRPDTPQDPGGGLPVENRMLGIDNTWHVTRLTTNDTHDMFPSIAGGLVTWQSSQGGSWNVFAYSMKTGATTKLSHDGTKSENPRFAVTWDEHDANGNARMVGYDIASGKTVDMTNEARNTPSGDAPYHPTETPISQPNQAALPPTGVSGTSTPVRADGDDGGGANPLTS